MTWFAVHETIGGKLRSLGTVLPAQLPADLTAKDVGPTRPDGVWNPATLVFDPRRIRRRYTVVALLRRFTRAERNKFRSSTDPVVSDFLFLIQLDDEVDADDPALSGALDMLEAKGILAAGRADEIKGPFA